MVPFRCDLELGLVDSVVEAFLGGGARKGSLLEMLLVFLLCVLEVLVGVEAVSLLLPAPLVLVEPTLRASSSVSFITSLKVGSFIVLEKCESSSTKHKITQQHTSTQQQAYKAGRPNLHLKSTRQINSSEYLCEDRHSLHRQVRSGMRKRSLA